MIVYNLACANEHRFEGWFSSSGDFDQQTEAKRLACPLCGDDNVVRLPHAAYVSTGAGAPAEAPPEKAKKGVPQQYANVGAELLAKLIEKVIDSTEDVGRAFPEEARKIHYNEAPERHIRGTASNKEVADLREEGIDVVALPVPPHRLSRPH